MGQQLSDIVTLIIKHLNGELDASGREQLDEWLGRSDRHRKLMDSFEDVESLRSQIKQYHEIDQPAVWNRLLERIPSLANEVVVPPLKSQRHLLNWIAHYLPGKPGAAGRRYALALAALFLSLLAAVSIYKSIFSRTDQRTADITTYRQKPARPGHSMGHLSADKSGTYLTLEGHAAVNLDSIHEGLIDKEGSTELYMVNDQIVYRKGDGPSESHSVLVQTSSGHKFCLRLPDNSKVTLDATSSLQFPTRFNDTEREVKLEGHAYFDIVKHFSGRPIPFYVKINRPFIKSPYGQKFSSPVTVMALGTSFNVMAYQDEPQVRTILESGVVRVLCGKYDRELSPGQQYSLSVSSAGIQEAMRQADLAYLTAWRKDFITFDSVSLKEVTRQLERWYNRPFVIKDSITVPFHFRISKNSSLKTVLDNLNENGQAHFRTTPDTIFVTR